MRFGRLCYKVVNKKSNLFNLGPLSYLMRGVDCSYDHEQMQNHGPATGTRLRTLETTRSPHGTLADFRTALSTCASRHSRRTFALQREQALSRLVEPGRGHGVLPHSDKHHFFLNSGQIATGPCKILSRWDMASRSSSSNDEKLSCPTYEGFKTTLCGVIQGRHRGTV